MSRGGRPAPVMELRGGMFPPRGGRVVYFSWPEHVGAYGTPGEAGDVVTDAATAWVSARYAPASRWEVTQWQVGRLGNGRPVVIARQIGG